MRFVQCRRRVGGDEPGRCGTLEQGSERGHAVLLGCPTEAGWPCLLGSDGGVGHNSGEVLDGDLDHATVTEAGRGETEALVRRTITPA